MPGVGKRRSRWANRSEEDRLRCRATERRGNAVRQCSESRNEEHEHQWGGKPFSPGYQEPVTGAPTVAPSGSWTGRS